MLGMAPFPRTQIEADAAAREGNGRRIRHLKSCQPKGNTFSTDFSFLL